MTEGEDKPLKYPSIFFKSELVVITKIDLLPYVPFDLAKARENCLRVHPEVEIVEVAATKDAGMDQWMNWLRKRKETMLKGRRAVLVN